MWQKETAVGDDDDDDNRGDSRPYMLSQSKGFGVGGRPLKRAPRHLPPTVWLSFIINRPSFFLKIH